MYFVSDDFRSNMEVSATTGGFKGCTLSYKSDGNTVTATKCDLYVAYNPSTYLPGMRIESVSSSLESYAIEQTYTSANMTFKNGTIFYLRGGIIDVTLHNADVGASGLDMIVEKGSISLQHLRTSRVTPGNSLGTLQTNGGGDITLTTDTALVVSYVHPEASYCFASKNVTVVSEVCQLTSEMGRDGKNASTSGNTTVEFTGGDANANSRDSDIEEDFMYCVGESILCSSNEDRLGCNQDMGFPRINLKVRDGSMYVTVEPGYTEDLELETILNIGDNEDAFYVFDNITNTTNRTTPALYLQQGVEMRRGPRFDKKEHVP